MNGTRERQPAPAAGGMHRMTDIHMHVIPGVDDGAYTLSMAEDLLILAWSQGVRAVFATPHSFAFGYGPELVMRQFQTLRDRMAATPFDLRLYLGCEVRCEPDSMEQTLDRLERGVYPTLNGTRYVLTEFSASVRADQALELLERLTGRGWRPVIAHVERYPGLFAGHGAIERLMAGGALLQLNAYSLEEEQDPAISARARGLLREGRVSFLGSDAHRMDHRPPSVRRGLEYLYAACPAAYADAAAFGNAERLLLQA